MPTVCMPKRQAIVGVIDVQSASGYVSGEFWGSTLRQGSDHMNWPAGLTITISAVCGPGRAGGADWII